MNVAYGFVGGAIGGTIGAAIWALISYGTGYEIGWIAWGVGALAGLGCLWGSRQGSMLMGCLAVVITLVSVLAGKYAAVQLYISKEVGSKPEVLADALTRLENEEFVLSFLADSVVEQRSLSGQSIDWPPGVDVEQLSQKSDYPPDIWQQAVSDWEQMNEADQQAYRDGLARQTEANVNSMYAEINKEGLLGSFAMMDILFVGLAVVTAYKIAGGSEMESGTGHPDVPPESVDEKES